MKPGDMFRVNSKNALVLYSWFDHDDGLIGALYCCDVGESVIILEHVRRDAKIKIFEVMSAGGIGLVSAPMLNFYCDLISCAE